MWRATKLGLGAAGVILSLGAAYEAGRSQSGTEVSRLLDEAQDQQELNHQLGARLAEAEQQLSDARASARGPAASGPQGGAPTADLAALIRAKLAEGVPEARLSAAIGAVSRERHCDPAVETGRLVLRTPVSRDATSARLAGGFLTVSGQGTSMRDPQGLPEAWFDPAKPVDLEIALSDGTSEKVSGPLPLTHAVVRSAHEYDLSAQPSPRRGVLEVSLRICDYP